MKPINNTIIFQPKYMIIFILLYSGFQSFGQESCPPGYESRLVKCCGEITTRCIHLDHECKRCWVLEWKPCPGRSIGASSDYKSYGDAQEAALKGKSYKHWNNGQCIWWDNVTDPIIYLEDYKICNPSAIRDLKNRISPLISSYLIELNKYRLFFNGQKATYGTTVIEYLSNIDISEKKGLSLMDKLNLATDNAIAEIEAAFESLKLEVEIIRSYETDFRTKYAIESDIFSKKENTSSIDISSNDRMNSEETWLYKQNNIKEKYKKTSENIYGRYYSYNEICDTCTMPEESDCNSFSYVCNAHGNRICCDCKNRYEREIELVKINQKSEIDEVNFNFEKDKSAEEKDKLNKSVKEFRQKLTEADENFDNKKYCDAEKLYTNLQEQLPEVEKLSPTLRKDVTNKTETAKSECFHLKIKQEILAADELFASKKFCEAAEKYELAQKLTTEINNIPPILLNELNNKTKNSKEECSNSREIIVDGRRILVAEKVLDKKMNYDDAEKACAQLGSGWRLPTTREGQEIYKKGLKIHISIEGVTYWCKMEEDQKQAWNSRPANRNVIYYVLAVRDL
jgi:hypothetical protein